MTTSPRWLLALESSTPFGGAALLRDGEVVEVRHLSEGLRHGRELMPAAAELLRAQGLTVKELAAVAVSFGPGSYTGIRVGVMAAKALAYAGASRLIAVSSLAALAESAILAERGVKPNEIVYALQDARRDEVYAGLFQNRDGHAFPLVEDAAITPEEAAAYLHDLNTDHPDAVVHRIGSGFSTYFELFHDIRILPGKVEPGAVGTLGWRQFLQADFADPLQFQPVYLRRDEGSDWRHDQLIGGRS